MAISADALQVYRGLGALTGAAGPSEQRRLEHRLLGFVPVTEPFSVGDYMPLAHAEIDAALAAGRLPIVVGGTGLYLRAALADLSLVKARPGDESELWSTDTRHPTLLVGLTMDREALYERIDARVDAIVAAGAAEEVRRARAAGASRTARKALGFDELLDGRPGGAQAAQPQLRPAPAHLDAQAGAAAARPGGHERHRARAGRRGGGYRRAAALLRPRPEPGVECRAVRFEKWQALGNDYVIVEADALPFELTPERVRALCAPHTGVGSDGVLLLSATEERGFVAALRIFNPDGSEAELSGNGVREAVMYLRRSGWAENDTFSISTAAGEVRPRITGPATCTVDMGRARLEAPDFPSGDADGRGSVRADDRELAFQFVSIGNPQCAIEVGEDLEQLDLSRLGPPIERQRAVSQPHQRLVLEAGGRGRDHARGSSSAGWGRPCPPARARPAPRWRRCSVEPIAR